tara:strand:- start:1005 stop:2339 length:1335 start_codon:yes stop_codon:yes gene_type:complete
LKEQEKANRYVAVSANEHGVKFIRLWFTDILGNLKGFAITVDELEEVLSNGASFDGAVIKGNVRSIESDMVAHPDASSWQILPWRPAENSVGRLFCDIKNPDGSKSEFDSREILKKTIKKASKIGLNYYVAPEIEYYYIKPENKQFLNDHSGYFDQSSVDSVGSDLRRETVLSIESMGIPVKHSHHEGANSQHEIDLRHTNALTMADSVITFRLAAKEIAAKSGYYASFMPRPYENHNGSGMHINISLFDGDKNIFFNHKKPSELSEIGKQFFAGLVKHSPEICLITNQWVNSYKRLIPGLEAPVLASWTTGDMNSLIRIPSYRPGREESVRIEYRLPDSATNPYLTFSIILAAGLKGIEKEYKLSKPITTNLSTMTPRDINKFGIKFLPRTLSEAILLAEESEIISQCLGKPLKDIFIENKKLEWEDFSRSVTDYEKNKYLFL